MGITNRLKKAEDQVSGPNLNVICLLVPIPACFHNQLHDNKTKQNKNNSVYTPVMFLCRNSQGSSKIYMEIEKNHS